MHFVSFRFHSRYSHFVLFVCVCVCRLLLRAECVYFNLSLSLLACIQFILFSFISFCVFIFLVGVSISLGESRYVCAMLCAVLFCSLTVKRRSHFLRNFWHEKIYYMNVYKMYFILNSMGFCLFHFRPLTHPLCIIFNSLFCELHCVTCMYTWFVHSFSSFFLSYFSLFIPINPLLVIIHFACACVRLREESVSSYASVCVLKHHINLSDKTIQLKGLLNLRERKKNVFDWIVPCTCIVTVLYRWPLSKWEQTVWHLKKIFLRYILICCCCCWFFLL